MPNNHPPLFPLFRSLSHADAWGGIMREGYAPCSLPAAPGHVPPARVCMADCIKHKQLYLIGLYPALITTNSQSLWTALLAPTTLRNKHGKSHSSVILRTEKGRQGHGGDVTVLMIVGHMQFTFTIIAIINCNTDYDDDGTRFIIAF